MGVVVFLSFLFFYCSECWFYFCIILGTVLPVTASAVAIKCMKIGLYVLSIMSKKQFQHLIIQILFFSSNILVVHEDSCLDILTVFFAQFPEYLFVFLGAEKF